MLMRQFNINPHFLIHNTSQAVNDNGLIFLLKREGGRGLDHPCRGSLLSVVEMSKLLRERQCPAPLIVSTDKNKMDIKQRIKLMSCSVIPVIPTTIVNKVKHFRA